MATKSNTQYMYCSCSGLLVYQNQIQNKQYVHKCNNCGNVVLFNVIYPLEVPDSK